LALHSLQMAVVSLKMSPEKLHAHIQR
jgi:hypothetical protein